MLATLIAVAVLADAPSAPPTEALPDRNFRVSVLDESAATVPGATVTIVPENRRPEIQGATGTAGTFSADLEPGRYRVTVTLTGFKRQSRRIVIGRDQGASSDLAVFRLKVAGPFEMTFIPAYHDHLRDLGSWRMTAEDLDRVSGH